MSKRSKTPREEQILKEISIEEIKEEFQTIEDVNNDSLVLEDKDYGLVYQDDNVVLYTITGLYQGNSTKKYKSRIELINNPPILTVYDSNNQVVSFVLTREFNQSLVGNLEDVERAYKGLDKPAEKHYDNFKDYFQQNKVRVIITSVLIIVLTVYILYLLFT